MRKERGGLAFPSRMLLRTQSWLKSGHVTFVSEVPLVDAPGGGDEGCVHHSLVRISPKHSSLTVGGRKPRKEEGSW